MGGVEPNPTPAFARRAILKAKEQKVEMILAALFPAWARYVYKENSARFAQLARQVWDVTEENDEKAALMGIEKMEEYFRLLKMSLSFREFDIPAECTAKLADLCTFGKQREIKTYISLDYDRVKEIFDSCY